MAGYDGFSMSNNARLAYDEGKVPYSKLRAWQKRAVDAGAVKPCEWHHSSKCFNIVNFYDLEDFEELKKEDYPVVKNNDKAQVAEETAVFEWKEWTVINRWGRKGFKKHEPVAGVIRDNWFYYVDDFGVEKKKSINGKHMLRIS